MTERKITVALTRIEKCKRGGFLIEAMVRAYLLNLDLLHYILSLTSPELDVRDKKPRTLVKLFQHEMRHKPEIKAVIHKQSLKSIKVWLDKMDVFFKALRSGSYNTSKSLMTESEQIYGLLKISTSKLLLRNGAPRKRPVRAARTTSVPTAD